MKGRSRSQELAAAIVRASLSGERVTVVYASRAQAADVYRRVRVALEAISGDDEE